MRRVIIAGRPEYRLSLSREIGIGRGRCGRSIATVIPDRAGPSNFRLFFQKGLAIRGKFHYKVPGN